MTSVKVSRDALVKTIRENRAKHVAEYKEALAGWRVDYEEWLRDTLEDVIHAEPERALFSTGFSKPKPTSHESEYDTALQMLEMSIDDSVILLDEEFRQLVQDQWHWKQTFSAINSAYLGKAAHSWK